MKFFSLLTLLGLAGIVGCVGMVSRPKLVKWKDRQFVLCDEHASEKTWQETVAMYCPDEPRQIGMEMVERPSGTSDHVELDAMGRPNRGSQKIHYETEECRIFQCSGEVIPNPRPAKSK